MTNGLLFSGRNRQVHQAQDLTTANETPNVSTSPALNVTSTSIPERFQSAERTVIAPPGFANTAVNQAKYRALPPRDNPSTDIPTTRKRKHVSTSKGSRPIHYFEGSSDEDEGGGYQSGDGWSSGESIESNAQTNTKRQKTFGIVTRSSARTPDLDVSDREHSDPASPTPTIPAPLPMVTASATVTANKATSATTTDPTNPQLSGIADAGAIEPPTVNTSQVDNLPRAEPTAVTHTDSTPTTADLTADGSLSAVIPTTPPVAIPATAIDVADVPAFLLSHGKGKREVDIFAYLNEVQDPHFRQILFHYIKFEANVNSDTNGTLSTKKRPAEIAQWTSRARPSNLPDLGTEKRTFQKFVNSVFEWWGTIQPSWRTFKRGQVSRNVGGSWEGLYAPRINGLLNVVMLAYWWVRILDEKQPEDGVREEYETFAEDVAWVLSKLSVT